MIAIIGSEGSMGKRYRAILKHLNQDFICLDTKTHLAPDIIEKAKECDAAIIATPTETHTHYLRALLPTKMKILCEKPITKDVDELERLYAWCEQNGYEFTMTFQYGDLVTDARLPKPSLYNYFRHGNDGLAWDCIQIIGLSCGSIDLREESPIWRCEINGEPLIGGHMDSAYVTFVRGWLLDRRKQDPAFIIDMHRRTAQMAKDLENGSN